MSLPVQPQARARVLIVDDHPLVRLGLETRINSQTDMAVCGHAASAEEAMALVGDAHPDLIVVDIALKGQSGLDLIKRLRASGCRAGIVAFSAHDERLFAERVLRAGGQGFVNKQEMSGSLLEALRAVLRGQIYLSPAMAQVLAAQVINGAAGRTGISALSDRELQVLSMIGAGLPTRAIAEQLHISTHTVESHRENIRTKLNLGNGAELTRYAVQWVLDSGQ